MVVRLQNENNFKPLIDKGFFGEGWGIAVDEAAVEVYFS